MNFVRLLITALFLLPALLILPACEGGEEAGTPPPAAVPAAPPANEPPAAASENPAALLDDLVATVNRAPISRQLLESQIMMTESGRLIFGDEMAETEDPEAKAQREAADLNLRRDILAALISLELACQEALNMGYAPADEELESAFNDLRNEYADPDQLHKALDQYGETEDNLREQLRKTMALKKWQDNEFLNKVAVSEEEAQAFYQANIESMRHGEMARASQIFIGIPIGMPPSAQTKALAQARAAQEALAAGEAFEEVALRFSNDPDVAETRGDLGWLDRETTGAMFNESIFSLKKGEISDLVETPLGYYIYKLNDLKEAGVEPFESAKPDIIEYLAEEKLTEAVRQRMLELEAAADIQILDPILKQTMQSPAPEPAARPEAPVNTER